MSSNPPPFVISKKVKMPDYTVGHLAVNASGDVVVVEPDGNNNEITIPLSSQGQLLSHDNTDIVAVDVGTDGQVLTANSSTASGLSWTTPYSPATTKGTLTTGNDTTYATLGVGTDGQILQADSGQPLGIKWADAPSSVTLPVEQGVLITGDGTTSVNLAKGTDGQVLTVNSGTTNGIEWTTPTSVLQPATKGDLVTHDDTDVALLSLGTDGQYLMADSTAATGQRWVSVAPSGNEIQPTYRSYPLSAFPISVSYTSGTLSSFHIDQQFFPYAPDGYPAPAFDANNDYIASNTTEGLYAVEVTVWSGPVPATCGTRVVRLARTENSTFKRDEQEVVLPNDTTKMTSATLTKTLLVRSQQGLAIYIDVLDDSTGTGTFDIVVGGNGSAGTQFAFTRLKSNDWISA